MTMQYTVIVAQHASELSRLVNVSISEGWIPQGGVSSMVDNGMFIEYCQAMTKHKTYREQV